MFRDEEFGPIGGEPWHRYVLMLCEGDTAPENVAQAKERCIAEAPWDQINFYVSMKVKKTGIGTWTVLTDGVAFFRAPTTYKIFVTEGQDVTLGIKAKP